LVTMQILTYANTIKTLESSTFLGLMEEILSLHYIITIFNIQVYFAFFTCIYLQGARHVGTPQLKMVAEIVSRLPVQSI
jgi:hypothetical protein